MKVILQQDVKGQGKKGQMIEASDGYARNFLLPRKLAVPATAENVNTMKMQEKAKKAQEAAEKAEAEATAAKLKELTVKVVAKGGNGGRLFGAVTSKEIADALQAQHGGFIKTMWCGELACELKMKEEAGVSSRCIPLEQERLGDTCACCGKPAKHMVYWGVAY